VIVSASRATDIPAFYSDWLFNRLRAGYCKWVNPFNGKPQYVSFEKTRAIVFWSKNPAPLLDRLDELDRLGLNYYFTFTLNDYERENLEPGLPPLAERIATFKRLAARCGKERVIWRFDPLVLAGALTAKDLLAKIAKVGDALHSYTAKLVCSFADIARYRKVQANLRRSGIVWREFDPEGKAETARGIAQLARVWGIEAGACGEAADLSSCGLHRNSCVDGELLARLFEGDRSLGEFLGTPPYRTASLFNRTAGIEAADTNQRLKDTGQRQACGCIVSKDIGAYDTCPQGCVYCYANTSAASAEKKRAGHDARGEAIGK